MFWEPFETQGSGLEGGCAGGELGLLSKKTVWWECTAEQLSVARDVLAFLCHCVTSASVSVYLSFAECMWLLLKPQGFVCQQARCPVALTLEEMLG